MHVQSCFSFLMFLLPLLSYLNLPNVVIISVLTPPSLRKQPTFFLASALVSPWNDLWGMIAEIPHWWCITPQIWIVPLIGWSKFVTNQMHYPDLGIDTLSEYENSAVISQMSFHRETRGGILKCWLFSQARPLLSREVQNVKHKNKKPCV